MQHHHMSDTRIPPMLIPSTIVRFDHPQLRPTSCGLLPADHQIVYFASTGLVGVDRVIVCGHSPRGLISFVVESVVERVWLCEIPSQVVISIFNNQVH